MRIALPEVSALEAWRLALGWSRAVAIEQIVQCYRDEDLRPPGLTESMLCRWEHDPRERPGFEYTGVISRAYGASLVDLELTRHAVPFTTAKDTAIRYGRPDPAMPPMGELMTTEAGLPAVRESLRLALLVDPSGGPAVLDAAEAAVEHYALGYSKHPPHVLFSEVRAAREFLTEALAAGTRDRTELHRLLGWLSGLLGNLAHHLDDNTGARVHLTAAATFGGQSGDAKLTAWAFGARSMTARARHRPDMAVEFAERALAATSTPLARAQILGWALLPSLAAQGRAPDAEDARRRADEAMEAAGGEEPGRFGFDVAELRLHEAEAYLALGQPDGARPLAEASAAGCVPGTPGWAAATLLLARTEAAASRHSDAAARALDVLDQVPTNRLRATTRARLATLDEELAGVATSAVRDLHERLRVLPPPVDPFGRAAPPDQT
ncbi:Twin-arginine translocation pathway signal [Streptomyces hainanensis]|uniref:Twin-arginine translocation pathway signal n=1 Tax=Streptomyces hainanensis TaxID=402648 RepID=A0A4V2Y2N6_9ACTN|nr:Twin-arginine translocation pathway signal [Streptomyces hainanensis]